jgi:poly-gamma-glutamate synthesis protein (capsule biosynthesis protein)
LVQRYFDRRQRPGTGGNARRRFLAAAGGALLGTVTDARAGEAGAVAQAAAGTDDPSRRTTGEVTLFLCGDVMTGRGIDQILPHPSRPELHEPYVRSALGYVALAEQASGPISRPVGYEYVWGDALAELARVRPDARIVNLETAVTTSNEAWPGKGIHYRMHPANLPLLAAARLDCCVLANNHVLDWGYAGLAETRQTLRLAGIRSAGAGDDAGAAAAPAIVELPGGRRVLVFAYCTEDSGVPRAWAAGKGQPGVHLLRDLSAPGIDAVARQVGAHKRRGDVVVASIHWGGNWGYDVPAAQRRFARALVDGAGVDLAHGHSSHHVKAIEIHRGRLILYGCGDFVNDYEGIGGYESYRGDLAFMYFPTLDAASGELRRCELVPTRMRALRVQRVGADDAAWLRARLDRESAPFGVRSEPHAGGLLLLRW